MPNTFKSRYGYALAAFLGCQLVVPVMLILSVTVSWIGGNEFNLGELNWTSKLAFGYLQLALILSFCASTSAFFCWPTRTVRSPGRMVKCGIVTTLMCFVLLGIAAGVVSAGELPLFETVRAIFSFVLLGSLFTLGIPYAIAASLSIYFAE